MSSPQKISPAPQSGAAQDRRREAGRRAGRGREGATRLLGPSGTPGPRPASSGDRRPDRDDAERRALADQITEDVLQLLFTAHQDLAELASHDGAVGTELLQSAQECTLGAISILRTVATTILDAAWGPKPTEDVPDSRWSAKGPVLFDALSDAWIVTCEHEDLLFASEGACRLLRRPQAELSRLMRASGGWSEIIARLPRTAEPANDIHFDVDVPTADGSVLPIHVHSHALPVVPGLAHSYISLITEREA